MASEQPPTDPSIAPEGGEAAPSKKGAKKAEAKAKKEAEKARKAAEREALAATQTKAASEDLATDNYGEIKKIDTKIVHLREIGEEHIGTTIQLRGWIQNARMQGAKMAFVELREEGNWTIQGVVAASSEGTPVSKQMVKWIGALKLESFVSLEATVQKPLEPVKSCKVSNYELHLTKVYLVAAAPETLDLGLAASGRAVTNLDDEAVGEQVEKAVESTCCLPWSSGKITDMTSQT